MVFGQKEKPMRKKPIPYKCKNCGKRTTSTDVHVAKTLKLCPDCREKKKVVKAPSRVVQSSVKDRLIQLAKTMSETKLVVITMRVKADKLEKNQALLKARINKIEKELG